MSTHEVSVVRVGAPRPHPNADRLEIIEVFGFVVCVPRGEFAEGDLAAYIEPDYLVPVDRPEFAFLAGSKEKAIEGRPFSRIGVRRLRGVYSQGLLIKAPPGMSAGENAMTHLEVQRYEPPMQAERGTERAVDSEPPPRGILIPKYDLENWRRYKDVFAEGEEVLITEKIHGANARFLFWDNRMWCGSRNEWKRESDADLWWRCLRENSWIQDFCRSHEGHVLYGEVFGQVQDLRYGAKGNQIFFLAFDIWSVHRNEWLSVSGGVAPGRLAPTVFSGPYRSEDIEGLSEGPSLFPGANHLREGIVIEAVPGRYNVEYGVRVKLKCVSNAYLAGGKS